MTSNRSNDTSLPSEEPRVGPSPGIGTSTPTSPTVKNDQSISPSNPAPYSPVFDSDFQLYFGFKPGSGSLGSGSDTGPSFSKMWGALSNGSNTDCSATEQVPNEEPSASQSGKATIDQETAYCASPTEYGEKE
jgi:hypothetical protein